MKWFRSQGERHRQAARDLRAASEAGAALVIAPSLLFIEVLDVAGRSWRLARVELERLAALLPRARLRDRRRGSPLG